MKISKSLVILFAFVVFFSAFALNATHASATTVNSLQGRSSSAPNVLTNLKAGQHVVVTNITGNYSYWTNGPRISCTVGMPAQCINGICRTGINNGFLTGAFYNSNNNLVLERVITAFEVANGVVVPQGATTLKFYFPDDNQKDNTGSCSFMASVKVQQNITCSNNSDCGTNAYEGSPSCQGKNIFKSFRTYTCVNPGTATSSCSSTVASQKIDECGSNQSCTNGACVNNCTSHASKKCVGTSVYWFNSCDVQEDKVIDCTGTQSCTNGACVNQNFTCSNKSDCGTDSFEGNLFCVGNSVYKNKRVWTCNNPGSANSYCSSVVSQEPQNACSTTQTCNTGTCNENQTGINISCYVNPSSANINQSVTFSCNVSGGNGNYTYSWSGACSGTSANCVESFNTTGTKTASVLVTSGSQSNSASTSVSIVNNNNNNCNQNSYQRCSGSYLYWYDSCGNQQGSGQWCPNGCSGNTCNNYNNNCNQNSYQRCVGNYLYWYDSCGNQQGSGQYCQNGCSGNTCNNYNNNNGILISNETVRNITNGSGFSSSVYAAPGDMLMFMITLQASGQDVRNVVVRDYLSQNLIYNNQLIVACSGNNCSGNYYNNYSGNIASGVNLNTIYSGQTVTITYQAQVANAQNFSYGTTTLNNNVSVTSSNTGYTPANNATVYVTRSAVYGASTISTGLTNNFWVDSFFLPLLITLICIWLWKSGMFFGIEKWLSNQKKKSRGFKAERELQKRIQLIKKIDTRGI